MPNWPPLEGLTSTTYWYGHEGDPYAFPDVLVAERIVPHVLGAGVEISFSTAEVVVHAVSKSASLLWSKGTPSCSLEHPTKLHTASTANMRLLISYLCMELG